MFESIKNIQLDIMLIISGLCVATALFMTFSKTLDRERKIYLVLTNIFATLLLVFDRYAYIFRGDTSLTGYYMVRISNFIVFVMTLLIRLDGENWASDEFATNDIKVDKTAEFSNWDVWKEVNKAGFDVSVTFERSGNNVTLVTKNKGIEITNITKIIDAPEKIYIALTGDQCALTNIRIKKED